MVIMPQLILLQKTLINIEGLGRELYPDLNLWEAARPSMERWMHDRVGLRGLYKGTRKNIPYWVDRLPEIPNKLVDLIERAKEGKLQIEWKSSDLERIRNEIRTDNKRKILAIIASAFVISAAVIYGFDGHSPSMLLGAPVISWVLGGFGAVVAFIAIKE